jgi:CRISPR/Cas system-associated protein Csm6
MAAGTPGRNTPPPVKYVGQMANHPITIPITRTNPASKETIIQMAIFLVSKQQANYYSLVN